MATFQPGDEHHITYGAHFPFETRPTIDFQIGNKRYGGPFRYLGHLTIFPTQTLRAAGIWIFSTQIFRVAENQSSSTQIFRGFVIKK